MDSFAELPGTVTQENMTQNDPASFIENTYLGCKVPILSHCYAAVLVLVVFLKTLLGSNVWITEGGLPIWLSKPLTGSCVAILVSVVLERDDLVTRGLDS